MTQAIGSLKLMTMQDVADEAGISYQTVAVHRMRGTMPDPEYFSGTSPMWKRATITKWLRTRRGPGRPTTR